MFKRICKYFGYTAVWGTALILALLLVIYLLIINSGFITKVALPVASLFSGQEIEAEKFEISPFRSRVHIRNFRLGDVDDPILTIGTLDSGYGFWRTVGGTPKLYDTVAGDVNVYLDLSAPASVQTEKDVSRLGMDLENLAVNRANVYMKMGKGTMLSVTGIDFKVDRIRNRGEGSLKATGQAAFQSGPDIMVKSGDVSLTGDFKFDRSPIPERLKLDLRLGMMSGKINGLAVSEQTLMLAAEAAAAGNGEITLRDFTFHQFIGDEKKSDVSARGHFNPEDGVASLKLAVNPLSPDIIRLASIYFTGIDPGSARLFYKGGARWNSKGTVIAKGNLKLFRTGPLTAAGEKFAVPEWDFKLIHDFTVNYLRRDAVIRAFSAGFSDHGRETIGIGLDRGPLTVNLNAPRHSVFGGSSPEWTFYVNELNLSAFNPLLAKWFIRFGTDSIADVRIKGKPAPRRGGFDIAAAVRGDRFFMRIDDEDLEYIPTDYKGTVTGNIDPFTRIFTVDKAAAEQSTARGGIGHAEVTGVWDLNTYVLKAHVEAGGVNNQAVSQQPMIPNFVREIIDHVMGKFFPAEYRFSGDAELDLWNGFLRVPRGRLRMLQEQAEQFLDISDFYINWDDEVLMGPCSAILHLQNLDTRQFTAWLPEGLPLRWAGPASGKVLYRMDGIATYMAADVDVNTDDFSVTLGNHTWRNLALSPRFRISLTDYDRVKVDSMEIGLKQGPDASAAFTLAPTFGSISKPAENPELNASLNIDGLSLAELNPLIPNPELQFAGGRLRSKLNGNFKEFARYMRLKGSAALDRFSMTGDTIHGGELALETDFTIGLDNFNQLQLPMLIVRGSNAGKSMGGAAVQGALTLDSGEGKFTADIQRLNQEFYAVFDPEFLLGGAVHGRIDTAFADHYGKFTCDGDLTLDQLQTVDMSQSVDGRCRLNYRRAPGHVSSRGNELKLNGLADLRWDFQDGHLAMSSTMIDLLFLKKLLTKPKEEKANSAPQPRPEPVFEFTPFTADLDLQGITFSDENQMRLTAKIRGQRRELLISPVELIVNKTPVKLHCEARSTDSGIVYNVALNTENLDFDPITTPMFDGEMKNLAGVAEKIDLQLTGHGLRYPAIWDNMNGYLVSVCRNIVIPNNFQTTITGRLLFLPLRVVNEIRYQMGGIKNKQLGNAFSRIVTASDLMRFNTGTISATIHDGRIKLDNVEFDGDFIKRLKFAGTLGFGSDSHMEVKSTINVEEVILPITIRGTVYEPEPDYAVAVVQFAAINTGSILKSIFGIFSSGMLQDVFEKIHGTVAGD